MDVKVVRNRFTATLVEQPGQQRLFESLSRGGPQVRQGLEDGGSEGQARLTEFLTGLGVINDDTRPVWKDLGLVA